MVAANVDAVTTEAAIETATETETMLMAVKETGRNRDELKVTAHVGASNGNANL